MRTREESEKQRYKEYYDLDPNDEKNYDLVVDSSHMTPEQVIEKIMEFLKENHNL